MNLILLRLCLATILLVGFVQAEFDYTKLTPEQKKILFAAISGSVGSNTGLNSLCSGNSCGPGKICGPFNGRNRCLVPEGNKCNIIDKCEGGYYCLDKGTCSGSGRKKEGDSCTSTTECDNRLYCDPKVEKCLVNKYEGIQCTKPSDCVDKCAAADCTCAGTKCVPR